jgi:GNAT superfamily N-acetyltransferase
MSEVMIERVGAEAVERFEPLWVEMLVHHGSVESTIPMQPPTVSWPLRRALYDSLLAEPGAFALLASRDGVDVGYCVVHLHPGPDDTWVTGDAIAEVESLAVTAGERGRGIGTLLLDRVDEELAAAGVADLQIAVVAANDDAMRFYARRGLRPRIVMLSNFGRDR